METTGENQVSNSYTKGKSLQPKTKARKALTNKKLKKNPVSRNEFIVEASDNLQSCTKQLP